MKEIEQNKKEKNEWVKSCEKSSFQFFVAKCILLTAILTLFGVQSFSFLIYPLSQALRHFLTILINKRSPNKFHRAHNHILCAGTTFLGIISLYLTLSDFSTFPFSLYVIPELYKTAFCYHVPGRRKNGVSITKVVLENVMKVAFPFLLHFLMHIIVRSMDNMADSSSGPVANADGYSTLLSLVLYIDLVVELARTSRFDFARFHVLNDKHNKQMKKLTKQRKIWDNRFIEKFAHEMNTNIGGVMIFFQQFSESQHVKCSPGSSKQEDYVKALWGVKRCTEEIQMLTNKLVDFRLLQTVGIRIVPKNCPLKTLVRSLVNRLRKQFESPTRELILKFKTVPPRMVLADPGRVGQVLRYIIHNALIYTEKGEVKVTCSYDKFHVFSVDVRDQGIGIDPQHLALGKIFEPFSKITEFSSHGLGLYLAKRITESMDGGKLQVSNLENGTLVHFETKVAPAFKRTYSSCSGSNQKMLGKIHENWGSKPKEKKKKKSMKVLIVEDNKICSRVATRLLKKNGITNYKIAYNGAEALKIVSKSSLEREDFDLILMDLDMPVMNGVDCTRELRKLRIKSKIFVCTATSCESDFKLFCKRHKFDGFIEKPLNNEKLQPALKQLKPIIKFTEQILAMQKYERKNSVQNYVNLADLKSQRDAIESEDDNISKFEIPSTRWCLFCVVPLLLLLHFFFFDRTLQSGASLTWSVFAIALLYYVGYTGVTSAPSLYAGMFFFFTMFGLEGPLTLLFSFAVFHCLASKKYYWGIIISTLTIVSWLWYMFPFALLCGNLRRMCLLLLTSEELVYSIACTFDELKLDYQVKQCKELRKMDTFIAKVYSKISHELQSPLTAMKCFFGVLYDSTDKRSPKVKEMFRNVLACVDNISQIHCDVLYLGRINNKKLTVRETVTNVPFLVESVVIEQKRMRLEKGVVVVLKNNLPAFFHVDHDKLHKVLVNVVSNSMKYTPKGCIRIECSYRPTTKYLEVSVSDSGIGFDPNNLKFDSLSWKSINIDKSKSSSFQLGLKISRMLCREMGGDLFIDSRPFRGTKVTIVIKAFQKRLSINTRALSKRIIPSPTKRITRDSSTPVGYTRKKSLVLVSGKNDDNIVDYEDFSTHYSIPRKIMMVSSHSTIQTVLRLWMQLLKYKNFQVFSDAQLPLKQLRNGCVPALIFLENDLKTMTGVEFIRKCVDVMGNKNARDCVFCIGCSHTLKNNKRTQGRISEFGFPVLEIVKPYDIDSICHILSSASIRMKKLKKTH